MDYMCFPALDHLITIGPSCQISRPAPPLDMPCDYAFRLFLLDMPLVGSLLDGPTSELTAFSCGGFGSKANALNDQELHLLRSGSVAVGEMMKLNLLVRR